MGNSHLSNIYTPIFASKSPLLNRCFTRFQYFENEFDIISLEYYAILSKIINVSLLNI